MNEGIKYLYKWYFGLIPEGFASPSMMKECAIQHLRGVGDDTLPYVAFCGWDKFYTLIDMEIR